MNLKILLSILKGYKVKKRNILFRMLVTRVNGFVGIVLI